MQSITPHIDLATMIEAHCAKSGMSPTAFGTAAVGDPSFVSDLKAGREPRRATIRRVVDFILTGKTYAEAKAEDAA